MALAVVVLCPCIGACAALSSLVPYHFISCTSYQLFTVVLQYIDYYGRPACSRHLLDAVYLLPLMLFLVQFSVSTAPCYLLSPNTVDTDLVWDVQARIQCDRGCCRICVRHVVLRCRIPPNTGTRSPNRLGTSADAADVYGTYICEVKEHIFNLLLVGR